MTQPSIDSIAPISRRAIAYLIDALISGAIGAVGFVVVAIVAFLPRPTEELLVVMPIAYGVLLLLLLGWFVFYTVMQTRGGSIGMRAQRLRLASAADGAPIGFGRALLRNVVFGLSTAIVVGYFTPLFDGSGRFQGWHDKVGNAVVVDAKKSPSPIRRTDAGAAAAAAPGAAAPVQTAPVGAPPVPLLPPAPLAGGYGAAPVPAPPGFPSAAGAPAEYAPGAPGFAAAQPGSPSSFAAPAAAAPFAAPSVPPVPSAPPVGVAPTGTASAFSVPADGSSFAVPPLPPHPGAVPPYPQGPTQPEPSAQPAPFVQQTYGQQQTQAPQQHAPAFGSPAAPAAPAFGAPAAPASGAPSAPAGAADSLIAFVPGVTPASAPAAPTASVPPASAPAAPAAPGVPASAPVTPGAPLAPAAPADEAYEEDVFEETIIQPRGTRAQEDAELESTRISIPGHRLLFTWDDGTRVTVSRRTLFGRNPAHEDGAERVVVRDETLSLSKTHFEAAAEVSGGWVLDRHSTNGMTIVRDGERIDCPPGQRVPVRLGDAIEIGDRILTIGGYV